MTAEALLTKGNLSKDELVDILQFSGQDEKLLFQEAAKIKQEVVGNVVYFRGLVEFSNICAKDCLYCGIRRSNPNTSRYNLSDEEILEAATFAHQNKYASMVLQAGELASKAFTTRVDELLKKIHQKTNGELRITLSLGEQSEETYRRWYESGAHRYLLRIESSNASLYQKIHPGDTLHDFRKRMTALETLKKLGYQTGTGVMIGLPFQTWSDLADDLLFMRDFGIDMVGMGPYIEHTDTPLYQFKETLMPLQERFRLALRMIALLRILMPDINIAAATALQAIDKMGREKAIQAGANVIMPNITPGLYRNNYRLYENKPCTDENADDCTNCLEVRIAMTKNEIALGKWGDSKHFANRVSAAGKA